MTDEVAELRAAVEELGREVAFLREATGVRATLEKFEGNPNVQMGENCKIAPGVRIAADDEAHRVVMGDYVNLYRGNDIIGPVTFGSHTYVNRDGYIRPGTTIGSGVSIGPFVRLVTDNHDIGPARRRASRFHTVPLTIEDGVWIGACVTVIGGVTVGAGSIIAAGAVVVRDVPPNTVVAGVPARVVKLLDGADVPLPPTRNAEVLRPALVAAGVVSGADPHDAEATADQLLAEAPDAPTGELIDRALHLLGEGVTRPSSEPEQPSARTRRSLRGWFALRRRGLRA